MALEFKTKNNSSRVNDVVPDSLANFILLNRSFLGLSLSILGEKKNPIDGSAIKAIVENNSRYNKEIETNSLVNDFINLIKDFYNTDADTLNTRRGRVLEIIWNAAGPYKSIKKYTKVEEAQVFHNGIILSDNDIDIVYRENFIELHECKASTQNAFRSPLKPKHQRKLELMDKTQRIANTESTDCEVYLITFDPNPNQSIRLLQKNKFTTFKIVCRRDIESRLA
jgi:hypothetical protein